MGVKPHTLAVRADRWTLIEKKAIEMGREEGKIIKPSFIAEALFKKGLDGLTIEDVRDVMKSK